MLKYCPNCREEVDAKHGFCPGCGEEFRQKKKRIPMDTFDEDWTEDDIDSEA